MEVWVRNSSMMQTNAHITKWGVELEAFEHDPDYKFETMKEFYLSWDDWDEIVAAVEKRRQEVIEG